MTRDDQPTAALAVVDRARFDVALAAQVALAKEVTRYNN